MNFKYLFLILISLSLVSSYFNSTFFYEKTWTIEGAVGESYSINATFLVNDSEQKVTNITLSEGLLTNIGGNLLFSSSGFLETNKKIIKTSANIDVSFNSQFSNDPPLRNVNKQINTKELEDLQVEHSSATTLLKINNWTHNSIEYNPQYADLRDPEEIYKKRKGVCVAYSGLLIQLLNFSNIKSREVLGFAEVGGWQAHSWVQVKLGNEWISVDPTFNQIGSLSTTHIKTYVMEDRTVFSDVVNGQGGLTDFSSNVELIQLTSTKEDIPIISSYEAYDGGVVIFVENPTNEYVFFEYEFSYPRGWGEKVKDVYLISPQSSLEFNHRISPEVRTDKNYVYNVPFVYSVMDQGFEGSTNYGTSKKKLIKEDLIDQLFELFRSFKLFFE